MRTAVEVKQQYFSKNRQEWESFFSGKKQQIEENIDVYLAIKEYCVYKKNSKFPPGWLFFAFYGMGGRLSATKKARFLSHFNEMHEANIAIVRNIVNEINGDNESCSYFSFVTKMLNMQDENFFPIYDSRVARAFCDKSELRSLDGEELCYTRIKELYDSIPLGDSSIVAFKEIFPKAANLGKMRILDFILYNSI